MFNKPVLNYSLTALPTLTALIHVIQKSYHCGIAAADELADLMEDALTVDRLVKRASLHYYCYG